MDNPYDWDTHCLAQARSHIRNLEEKLEKCAALVDAAPAIATYLESSMARTLSSPPWTRERLDEWAQMLRSLTTEAPADDREGASCL